jgi:hypothetical protein
MEYRGFLNLSVFGDLIAVPIVITHKELEVGAEVIIRIEYKENTYLGVGKSLEWTDAFANLQKALPDDVKVQCCMTCRHGTLCPYGNVPNYILCSKNVVINDKDDVIDWLDKVDVKSIEKYSFGCCEKYDASNENDYTYNDYLYYLNH